MFITVLVVSITITVVPITARLLSHPHFCYHATHKLLWQENGKRYLEASSCINHGATAITIAIMTDELCAFCSLSSPEPLSQRLLDMLATMHAAGIRTTGAWYTSDRTRAHRNLSNRWRSPLYVISCQHAADHEQSGRAVGQGQ